MAKFLNWNRSIPMLIVGLLAAKCLAAPSAYGWTPSTKPYYYSSTNNRVGYGVTAGSQERIRSIKLYIDYTLVKTVIYQGGSGQVKNGVVNAIFDATYFADGYSVETHVDVEYDKLISGVWVQQSTASSLGSATINAINKATSYAQPKKSPEDMHPFSETGAAELAKAHLQDSNYSVDCKVGATWDRMYVLNNLSSVAVQVLFCHGTPSHTILGTLLHLVKPFVQMVHGTTTYITMGTTISDHRRSAPDYLQ